MNSDRILMSSPDVGDLEEQYVVEAMRSGWIAPLGPDVDAFENELASRVGVNFAVALSSGTAALHLGLLGMGVKPGDLVLTSTLTFAATANAVIYTGARPYFIDCDQRTGNMDPEILYQTMKKLHADGVTPAAILPVDLFGKAADYTAILGIADDFGVPVLSDAAESLGASHAGRPSGSFGRASAVSFNGNKIMTTSGGGALLTDDEGLAIRTRYLATQARQPAAHYEHTDIGYNYRLSNLLAALGRAQLVRLDDMIARRREIRARYKQIFAEAKGADVFGSHDDEFDNAWLSAVIVNPEIARWTADDLGQALHKANIESRPLWKPMHLQPVFKRWPAAVSGAAERLFRNGVTLPSGSALSGNEIERVCEVLTSHLES